MSDISKLSCGNLSEVTDEHVIKVQARIPRDLSNLFKNFNISSKGAAIIVEKKVSVDKPIETVEITQPCTSLTSYDEKQSKHKEICIDQADQLIELINDYFMWYVSQNCDSQTPRVKNVFREACIDSLKYPWVFCNPKIEHYFVDSVSNIFRDAKQKHGHRSTFKELDFTYFSADKQNVRAKLLFHKKGHILKR